MALQHMAALAGSQAPLLLGAIPKQNGVPGCSEAIVPPRAAQLEWGVYLTPWSRSRTHRNPIRLAYQFLYASWRC